MKKLVLVSHGKVAEGLLSSLDIIAGGHDQVFAVTFDGQMSMDELTNQIENVVGDDEATIVVDLPGGSPCNAVLTRYASNDRIHILASLNLPMVLDLYLNLNNDSHEVAQSIKNGQDNMYDVKAKFKQVTNS